MPCANGYWSIPKRQRAGFTRRSRKSLKNLRMDKLARLTAQDRQDIFTEAAAQLGIRPTIIEKDFWVCVVLKLLFLKSRFGKSLVFKGGTSLSKAHGMIERFSEDIDLVLDWEVIGFGEGVKDPLQNFDSKSKQDRFNKEINRQAADFIATTLCPELDGLLRTEGMGLSAAVETTDPHVINIRYPAAFSEAYIRPEVRLEIGPLASWVPSAIYTIRPYAYDALPRVFENPACEVVAISAERTFLGEGNDPSSGSASGDTDPATLFTTLLSPLQTGC